MNFPATPFYKQNESQTIAVSIESTFIQQVMLVLAGVLSFFSFPVSKSSPAVQKLKMQLLFVYAIPSLFIFGASGIVLIALYFCIFELVLAIARKVAA